MSSPRAFVLPTSRVVYQLRRFARRPAMLQSALLAALLAVFFVASFQVRAYAGDVQRDAFMLQTPIPTPVLRFTPPAATRLPVVAIIAHGYAASKEIMSAFAVDLAQQGITTYTFDFPGHGASPADYGGPGHDHVVQQLNSALGEVVDYASGHAAPGTKIVLLGYSLGTIPVAAYALQHPHMSSLQATVLVAGILQDKPTLTTPRNLLVLSGQFDLPGINDIARGAIASACGKTTSSIRGATYQCQTSATDQRKRVILPGLDHISIVTAASTHNVVIKWLGTTVDARIGQTPVNADVRLHWMLLGFLAALLAVGPLIKLLALAFGVQPPHDTATHDIAPSAERQTNSAPRLLGFAALAGTLTAALLALRMALPSSFWAQDPRPFTFLRQQVSADVAIYFLFAGILITGVIWGIQRFRTTITLPAWREALPQALIALLVTVFLTLTLGSLSTYAWESLALEPQRLWRGAIYVFMLWPFFFGFRSLLLAMAPRFKRPALADLSASLLIILALVGSIAMNFGRLSYLGILLPIFGIVLLLIVGAASWVRRTVAHPVVLVSALEAMLLAWALAATLPLVA
jgi:pimeloyl-ACP methyl ester carboxylesterase